MPRDRCGSSRSDFVDRWPQIGYELRQPYLHHVPAFEIPVVRRTAYPCMKDTDIEQDRKPHSEGIRRLDTFAGTKSTA